MTTMVAVGALRVRRGRGGTMAADTPMLPGFSGDREALDGTQPRGDGFVDNPALKADPPLVPLPGQAVLDFGDGRRVPDRRLDGYRTRG